MQNSQVIVASSNQIVSNTSNEVYALIQKSLVNVREDMLKKA
jgi:hypothetical protein